MKLSPEAKSRLIQEIKYALDQMKQESAAEAKLYYFSAVFGTMNRLFNFECSPDLVFAHSVLSSTHSQLNARLQSPEKVVSIPPEAFDKLYDATEELLQVIKMEASLYDVLRKFALLGYVTGGNGYYLYQKGLIKL